MDPGNKEQEGPWFKEKRGFQDWSSIFTLLHQWPKTTQIHSAVTLSKALALHPGQKYI